MHSTQKKCYKITEYRKITIYLFSNQFHILYTCKITTATGWQANFSLLLLLLLLLLNVKLRVIWNDTNMTRVHDEKEREKRKFVSQNIDSNSTINSSRVT